MGFIGDEQKTFFRIRWMNPNGRILHLIDGNALAGDARLRRNNDFMRSLASSRTGNEQGNYGLQTFGHEQPLIKEGKT
ncbi:MAG TPA: hypothetical protein VGN88_02100 [Phycisphaerae bacterium]